MLNRKILLVAFALFFTEKLYAQPFFKVGNGVNHFIYHLFADSVSNVLFATGTFDSTGSIPCNHVAKWNGLSWDSVNTQLKPFPTRMARFNNNFYISDATWFDSTGNTQYARIAKWDSLTHTWISFGANPNDIIKDIAVHNSQMYVTGYFDSIGGVAASKIARYDGLNWYSYPPLDTSHGGFALCTTELYNGQLYAGGNFYSTIIPNANDIARFDGSQWNPLGNAFANSGLTSVSALIIYQGKLIVGGYFNTAWGNPGNGVAAWDGSSWSQLGSNMSFGNIKTLQVYNGELWAGGGMDIDGKSVRLAKFNGINWDTLSINLDNSVNSLAVLGNDLYIGGAFWTMNGDSVHHIIKYNPATGFQSFEAQNQQLSVYPNPTGSYLNIVFRNKVLIKSVSIYNSLGNQVNSFLYPSNPMYVGNPASGIYLLKVQDIEGKNYNTKFLVK